jgi:glycosyltransferase involved in cell wall biosynthesis
MAHSDGRILTELIKIRFVLPRFAPSIGGVETRVREIATRLGARGYLVEVCSFDASPNTKRIANVGRVRITRFRGFAPSEAYYFPEPAFCHWARRHPVNIVEAHNIHALPAAAATVCKSKGERLFLTPHYHGEGHTIFRRLLFGCYKNLAKVIIDRCERVICVSDAERALFERDFVRYADKTVLVPNGIDSTELKRYSWNPSSENKTLLYVGRLEKYKNVDILIRATALLKKRMKETIRLVIIGSGPCEGSLRRLCTELELQDTVNWIRSVTRDDLLKRYRSAVAFVLLSTHEAYSFAAADAMALGVPTVVADAGSLSTYVRLGLASGVSMQTDSEEVAERLKEIIKDPPKYARQKESAKYFISWDEIATKLENVYARLL